MPHRPAKIPAEGRVYSKRGPSRTFWDDPHDLRARSSAGRRGFIRSLFELGACRPYRSPGPQHRLAAGPKPRQGPDVAEETARGPIHLWVDSSGPPDPRRKRLYAAQNAVHGARYISPWIARTGDVLAAELTARQAPGMPRESPALLSQVESELASFCGRWRPTTRSPSTRPCKRTAPIAEPRVIIPAAEGCPAQSGDGHRNAGPEPTYSRDRSGRATRVGNLLSGFTRRRKVEKRVSIATRQSWDGR